MYSLYSEFSICPNVFLQQKKILDQTLHAVVLFLISFNLE